MGEIQDGNMWRCSLEPNEAADGAQTMSSGNAFHSLIVRGRKLFSLWFELHGILVRALLCVRLERCTSGFNSDASTFT